MTPLACPRCGESLARAGGARRCASGHAFDVARQGYVNFLSRKPEGFYEEPALFQARREAFAGGVFAGVVDAAREAARGAQTVFDAGCGEGSLLSSLDAPVRAGLDISRAAVRMAAARDRAAWWCVGDLRRPPLPEGFADAIVNCLAPADYAAFLRILAPGGTVIKFIPNPGHLAEMREAAGLSPYAKDPARTPEAFAEALALEETRVVRYAAALTPALAAAVYAMTPLTARAPSPKGPLPDRATIDVTMLRGRRR